MNEMEEKSELNNIVIDDEQEEKIQSSKKILLISAAAIVLFLIVIVAVYSLNQGDEEENTSPVAVEQGLQPAEKADNIIEAQKAEEPKFEQVPIKDETPANGEDKFEKIVKEIKAKQQNAEVAEPANLPPPPTEEPKAEPVKEVLSQTAPVVEKKEESPVKKLIKETAEPKGEVSSVPSGYYIQVGSFAKFTPNKKFLTTIKENGYEYHILKTELNGKNIQRVLIGPFKDRDSAKKANVKVKEDINKDAFIKKI